MPYLNQDIVLYVDPTVILGREGDEVVVISQKGHVLIVQHVAKLSNPFPVTTQKIRNDEGKYTDIHRGTETVSQPIERPRAKSPKRNVDSKNKKRIPEQPIPNGQGLFDF